MYQTVYTWCENGKGPEKLLCWKCSDFRENTNKKLLIFLQKWKQILFAPRPLNTCSSTAKRLSQRFVLSMHVQIHAELSTCREPVWGWYLYNSGFACTHVSQQHYLSTLHNGYSSWADWAYMYVYIIQTCTFDLCAMSVTLDGYCLCTTL